jgi:hypothetical protein
MMNFTPHRGHLAARPACSLGQWILCPFGQRKSITLDPPRGTGPAGSASLLIVPYHGGGDNRTLDSISMLGAAALSGTGGQGFGM